MIFSQAPGKSAGSSVPVCYGCPVSSTADGSYPFVGG
jgi:hypothetical protein